MCRLGERHCAGEHRNHERRQAGRIVRFALLRCGLLSQSIGDRLLPAVEDFAKGMLKIRIRQREFQSQVIHRTTPHCRTIFAAERGVVASSKMLPVTDHKVVPEGGDEETHERGST